MIFLDYHDRIIRGIRLQESLKLSQETKRAYKYNKDFMLSLDDRAEIEKVGLGKDGGLRMYLYGAKEPIRMYPDANVVFVTAIYKRFIPLIGVNLAKMGWIKRVIVVLAIKFNFNLLPQWFEYVFSMGDFLLKDENYSQPVKEVRRVLKNRIEENLLNAITLILEYDSAYRYRFQDVFPLLDKTALKKNPADEIIRILTILENRDNWNQVDKDNKWTKFKKLIRLLFFLSPKTKKLIIDILTEINADEIKFSKEDLYWVNQNKGYPYRGMTIEERLKDNIRVYGAEK